MGDLWLQVLTRDDRDLAALVRAFQPKMLAEDIIGYETMIRADPSRVQLHDDVAVLYLELGRAAEAAAHFEAAVALTPESAAAHFNLGTAQTMAGRLEEAIGHYQRALQIRPDYALAHNNLGNVLLRLGQSEEALRHFRDALRLDPSNAEAHYNAGSVLRARGNLAGALGEFRQAVQLKPDSTAVVASLAWLLATAPDAALRNADEAVHYAEHAADLTRRADASALDVLAAAYASAGQFDRAIAAGEHALTRMPDEALAAAIRQRLTLYRQRRAYVSAVTIP
jgi:tetratricopeptide (TPR) repeat protein